MNEEKKYLELAGESGAGGTESLHWQGRLQRRTIGVRWPMTRALHSVTVLCHWT